jgi:N-acetylglucosamine-6-phosphate deacetylase
MMTLSPEVPGAMAAIEFLAKNGIVAAAGHTNADHLTIGKAVDKGLRHVTHIFNNGEDGIGQEKGIFDAKSCALDFLLRDELTAGIIADGVHVPPRMMELLYRVKGPARTVVTTDSCLATDYNRERFIFTELTGEVRDFVVRGALYEASTGQLCGSVLSMEKGFTNIQAMAKVGRVDAAYSCATLPHLILGNKNKGIISEGAEADIAVINRNGAVTLTLVGGEIVFRN